MLPASTSGATFGVGVGVGVAVGVGDGVAVGVGDGVAVGLGVGVGATPPARLAACRVTLLH